MQENEKKQKPPSKRNKHERLQDEMEVMIALFNMGLSFGAGLIAAAQHRDQIVKILQGKEAKNATERGQSEAISQDEEGGHGVSNQEENARDSGEDG